MKILLLEDRIDRMKQFSKIDLFQETTIDIISGTELVHFIANLESELKKILPLYQCVILHRSGIDNIKRDVIKAFCGEYKISLVYFSGGISSSKFSDSDFPFLHINSKDFYSDNLKLFINDFTMGNAINLIILQFGQNWKLSLLLKMRNDLNMGIQSNSIKRIKDLGISNLLKDELLVNFDLPWFTDNFMQNIEDSQIQEFKKKLDRIIMHNI